MFYADYMLKNNSEKERFDPPKPMGGKTKKNESISVTPLFISEGAITKIPN